MATPPNSPPPNQGNPGGPFQPGDPRNQAYAGGPYSPDPRIQREQERAWAEAQREQGRAQRQQAKAWTQYQREASRQQVRAMRQQARMAAETQRAQFRAVRRSNRAQSIIGPLLLIAIASVALLVYNGRIPAFELLGWFARWWPLVLIAAGVLRLVEWAIARHQSESRGVPVRFAIGGGTVWLLILISVLGLAAQGGIHHIGNQWNFGWTGQDFNQFFGSKHEEDAAAVTHTIAPEGTLEIHNDHGDVTVDGTSDDGLIHLAEHKEVFANDDGRVNNLLSELDPQFTGSDPYVVLRVASNESSSAGLTLTVPRGVHVVLNSNHGDVAVHSFHAPVSINANHGDVELSGIAGDVQVRTNSRHGEVQIHSVQGAVLVTGSGNEVNLNDIHGTVGVNGNFFGSGHLQHVAGAVNYNAGRISFTAQRVDGEVSFDEDDEFTARGVAGPITVHTRSRNITLDRVSGDMQVTNSSGHVDITAVQPTGAITVDNRDGDVSLSLPGSAKFSLAAETSDGTVQSDFPGTTSSNNQSHRGTLTTTVGVGGSSIRLTTTHGNIALARNEQAPLPPMPPLPPSLTTLPSDVSQSMKDARKEIADAQREATQARREAERARKQALADAGQARKQAERSAGSASTPPPPPLPQ
ncbi:DUF4097 family beta strand repeat-containing protein [Terriglobus sp.]|uniref:DUF4097 family beta strand repeat-containing protein n=1 Tax=Terriglobus sp. TaxID=1889013 RepID=UPI003B00E306